MSVEGIALNAQEQERLDELWSVAEDGDHYALLGVDENAVRMDIQKAFHTLSRVWHPDRYFRKDLGEYQARLEAVFIAITDAYRTLSNDSARRAYDVERENTHKRKGRRHRRRAAPPSEAVSESTAAAAQADVERSSGRRSSLKEGRTAGRGRKRRSGPKDSDAPRRASRPSASTAGGAARSPAVSKAMAQMRKQLRGQLRRARALYAEGMAHVEAGSVLKASNALSMAASFDPRNEQYRQAAEDALRAARKVQAKNFVALAESAESFANVREALANYQKAVEYGAEDARPYFRLGVLLRRVEDDHRAALDHFRTAVSRAPNSVEYRLALGELYADLGLKVNAQGQFKRVLAIDKSNAKAKAGLRGL